MTCRIIEESGILWCPCEESWWIQEADSCSPTNSHYELWEGWKATRLAEEMTQTEANELESALNAWRRPTGPSVWDYP